jgi:anti-anti-sigma factor
MSNTKNINDYVSTSVYQGKQSKFNVFQIEAKEMDHKIAPDIKAVFVDYFAKGDYKKLGITKHALDVSKVEYMDSSGLCAILVFNRLSFNAGDGYISLIGCGEAVEKLMKISQLDTVLDIKSKASDL